MVFLHVSLIGLYHVICRKVDFGMRQALFWYLLGHILVLLNRFKYQLSAVLPIGFTHQETVP